MSSDPISSLAAVELFLESDVLTASELVAPDPQLPFERYLAVLWDLQEEHADVGQGDLAARLGLSRSTVSTAIRQLEDSGLVTVNGRRIELTADGSEIAATAACRRRVAECLLGDVLGIAWADVHLEGTNLGAVLSTAATDAVLNLLGRPVVCPHGNPIPGVAPPLDDGVRLSTVAPGSSFRVLRVGESLGHQGTMLAFLHERRLSPHAVGVVTDVTPDGTVMMRTAAGSVATSSATAGKIIVSVEAATPAPAPAPARASRKRPARPTVNGR